MSEAGSNGGTGDSGTLRIRDRIPVEVRPLGPEWIAEAESGRLGPELSDRPEGDNRRYASVDELLGSYAKGQGLDGPLAEALRLLDAKMSYLITLLEERVPETNQDLPPARSVELGLDGMRVDLPESVPLPERGGWVWIRAYFPGRPRIGFQTPARVRTVDHPGDGDAEAALRADLAFANITENEERALSGYIFRRHREEVRRRRERGSG
ncbi:hypothetical protein [Thiohalorhabdus methylotrophus]|uniref:PilZ domain-containing protein n=1 Tax=Thiohalorhabdus methylotrophus TaxID=3242694 RepID=A0ABV4TW01_9GAMM